MLSGPALLAGEYAQRSDDLDLHGRLGTASVVEGRTRRIAMRNVDEREGGDSSRPAASLDCTRTSSTRASSGPSFADALSAKRGVGSYPAVVQTISGQGWVTGFGTHVLDATDPSRWVLGRGYLGQQVAGQTSQADRAWHFSPAGQRPLRAALPFPGPDDCLCRVSRGRRKEPPRPRGAQRCRRESNR